MSNGEPSKSILNPESITLQVNDILQERLKKELDEVKKEVRHHGSHPLKWIAIFAFFILVGLNGFICYQELQQSRQLNDLIQQLTPASQTSPGTK